MASLAAYAEQCETEGEYKRQVLESVRNERPVWEIALGITYESGKRGETYEAIKSKAAKSPYLGRGKLTDENLKLSLSVLRQRRLIRFHKKTQTYTTAPRKPLPLR